LWSCPHRVSIVSPSCKWTTPQVDASRGDQDVCGDPSGHSCTVLVLVQVVLLRDRAAMDPDWRMDDDRDAAVVIV